MDALNVYKLEIRTAPRSLTLQLSEGEDAQEPGEWDEAHEKESWEKPAPKVFSYDGRLRRLERGEQAQQQRRRRRGNICCWSGFPLRYTR